MPLSRTRVFCPGCGADHDGEVLVRDGAVYGAIFCPAGARQHLISSNAELYLELNGRSWSRPSAGPEKCIPPQRRDNELHQRAFLNFIPITNACNFKCAVCAAHEPGETGDRFLTMDEILRRAVSARRGGARLMHLIGGEPTLHPGLPAIIQRLVRMGLIVVIASNGHLLGEDPELARRLKRAGLSRVALQFDSLDEGTLATLHRSRPQDKAAAIRNILAAGLNIGFNAVVTRRNLAELPRMLEHHLALGSQIKNALFASAAPVGRFELPPEEGVDREQMVLALMKAGEKFGFGLDDVMPMPAFPAWGLGVHPDCGVHILLLRTPEGVQPLSRFIDLRAAYRRLARADGGSGPLATWKNLIGAALGAARPGRGLQTLGLALRLLLKRPGVSLINIGIADYRAAMFLDRARLARCSSVVHTSLGPVPTCYHFFAGPRAPFSRASEVLRGQC